MKVKSVGANEEKQYPDTKTIVEPTYGSSGRVISICSVLHTSGGPPVNLTAAAVASEYFLSSTSFRTSASASGAFVSV